MDVGLLGLTMVGIKRVEEPSQPRTTHGEGRTDETREMNLLSWQDSKDVDVSVEVSDDMT